MGHEKATTEIMSPPSKIENIYAESETLSAPGVGQVGFDEQATKKLLRKIDWAIIPLVAVLYLLSFLDRANIGNARLAGLEEDLGMKGLDYNIAVVAFFPTYILAEVPSNLMLKRLRPSLWISLIMVAWGICTTLMGIVHNFPGLLAARCALGLAEAGLFPGVAFYITMWYRRQECGLRLSLFFSAATFAGAFGGLLARGIMEMNGLGNLRGWSWIFIIEGIATTAVAVVAYFVMADFPHTANFLSTEEREEVVRRLEADQNSLSNAYDMKFFWDAMKDWKIWTHCLIMVGNLTPLYSVSLFLPTVVKSLGYQNETAQLMSVPAYVPACIFCLLGGFFADRLQTRGIFMIGMNTCALIGMIMLIFSEKVGVRYAGTFFMTAGIYPQVPQGIAWNSNNIGGSVKRSVGIGLQAGIGNCGGIIASFIFLPKDAPLYRPGFGILIGFQVMALTLSVFMTLYLRRENRRRDGLYKPPTEFTNAEKELEKDKGDDATFFRFTV